MQKKKGISKELQQALYDHERKRVGDKKPNYVTYHMFGSRANEEASKLATQIKKALHSALVPSFNPLLLMVDGDDDFGIDREALEAGNIDAKAKAADISRNTVMQIFIVALDDETARPAFDEQELERCRTAHKKLNLKLKGTRGRSYVSFEGEGLDPAYVSYAGLLEQREQYYDKLDVILPAYEVVYVWVPNEMTEKAAYKIYKHTVFSPDPRHQQTQPTHNFHWKELRHVLGEKPCSFNPWINKAGEIVFPLQEDFKPRVTYTQKLHRESPFDGEYTGGTISWQQNQLCKDAIRREIDERLQLLNRPTLEEEFESLVIDTEVAFACRYCGGKGTAGAYGFACPYCGGKKEKEKATSQPKQLRQVLLKNP